MPVCVIGTIFIRHFVRLVPFSSASLCDKKHCYTPVSVIGTIVIRLFPQLYPFHTHVYAIFCAISIIFLHQFER